MSHFSSYCVPGCFICEIFEQHYISRSETSTLEFFMNIQERRLFGYGASRGIGRAIALELVTKVKRLLLVARDRQP